MSSISRVIVILILIALAIWVAYLLLISITDNNDGLLSKSLDRESQRIDTQIKKNDGGGTNFEDTRDTSNRTNSTNSLDSALLESLFSENQVEYEFYARVLETIDIKDSNHTYEIELVTNPHTGERISVPLVAESSIGVLQTTEFGNLYLLDILYDPEAETYIVTGATHLYVEPHP